MSEAAQPSGPDFRAGIPESALADGCMLAGHVGDDAVLVARRGEELFAIGATCTHYGGPLPEGLLVGETVRCPWHHACFSLRTGEALAPPALAPVARWHVERKDGRLFVTEKEPGEVPRRDFARRSASSAAERVVIISGDESAPYDRPNLSKDYLAGTAPEEWIPLRPDDFYKDNEIDLRLGTEA